MPAEEEERQRTLERYGVLDSEKDENLQRIVRLAARILQTQVAIISLVDKDRQWFLAKHGLIADETPREMAFCAHTICEEEALLVEDARNDPRFCANPLVTGATGIRFYAGVPLQDPSGHNLGALCVIDQAPRKLSRSAVEDLKSLSQIVLRELELKKLQTICPITHSLLRKDFLRIADIEIRRSRDKEEPMAFLLLEFEDLYAINQRCGLMIIDEVLKQLGQRFQAILEPSEYLGRLGDSLLGLVMINTDKDQALLRAEVLLNEISEPIMITNMQKIELDVSGGMTQVNNADTSIDQLLARSKQGLLIAENNGGKQVVQVLDLDSPRL